MDTLQEFENKLPELLNAISGPLQEEHGYDSESIQAAEAKLGVRLPAVLQHCYGVAGKHHFLRRGLQNLVSLEDLELRTFGSDGEGLIFLLEQQEVTFSVIRAQELTLDDPPVYQGNHQEEKLYLDCARLSSFLLKTLGWNAVELQPSGAEADINQEQLARLRAAMTFVECGPPDYTFSLQVYRCGSVIACCFPNTAEDGETFPLVVSGQNDEELRSFEEEFGIEISWL